MTITKLDFKLLDSINSMNSMKSRTLSVLLLLLLLLSRVSRVRLLATPWTAAYQALPSMGFFRQEYWSGLPLPSPLISFPLPKSDTGNS